MVIVVHLLSVGIFDICFQWDSKLKNIHLFFHSIDSSRSGLCSVTRKFWGTVSPMGRVIGIHWRDSDILPEMEFKEFEPRFKSAKTRFKFSAGLNLETFDTILSGTNHI